MFKGGFTDIDLIDEDTYADICERADYWGMESLTEDEQYILMHAKPFLE